MRDLNPIPDILPGDCILYFGDGLFDWVIALKTWNKISHVEVALAPGLSAASRNGLGVNIYVFRRSGLAMIRRPLKMPDIAAARKWLCQPYDPDTRTGILGQKYDWLGLLCFTMAVSQGSPDRMFCSEFATHFYRQLGIDAMASDYPADKVAPAQYEQSPAFTTVWKRSTNN